MNRPTSSPHMFGSLLVLLLLSIATFGQEKQMVRVKTFDQQLRPFKHINISINGNAYISTGEKGMAFTEIDQVESIDVKNEELEVASWNHSQGTLEIIIRKKNYKLYPLVVRDRNNTGVAHIKITFTGIKTVTGTTDSQGSVSLPLSLNDEVTATDQFQAKGFNVVSLRASDGKNILLVDRVESAVGNGLSQTDDYFKNFDLSKLDSIRSLTVFYAIFKDYGRENLSEEDKRRVDAKFEELVGQLQDSIKSKHLSFIGKITDSTIVEDDIENLLAQARVERQMLITQQNNVEQKIKVINDKLVAGFENLNEGERAKLLSDLSLLEEILTENENSFYKNQNNYRQVISSLKDRFFDLENLENKLSASEAQRLKEQRIFRQRLFAILSVVAVFAILIILLIYFSNKLKKQKQKLIMANEEIKRVNENLEGLVFERTKLLIETNKELDTVLYRASHDLRSPVRSIIGLCNLANGLSNDESKEVLERVVETTVEMDRLLKKLSVISEINEPTNFSPVTLSEIVKNIQDDFTQIIQDHGINFIIDCPPDLVINTYPNLIEIILINLIENALFYCMLKNSGNSQVRLTANRKGEHLELILLDNGIGVDSTISDKLFDMFFKGHERSKGNGLGLYIVQKSVHALNGKIVVESEPGQFAKFFIQIPLEERKEELAAISS